jgi:hypothetical protein
MVKKISEDRFVKFIYWRDDIAPVDGNRFANVHLLVDLDSKLSDYLIMAEELRKTFPQAGNDRIQCGIITRSSFYRGYSIITFNAHIPAGGYPGWQQENYDGNKTVEYQWCS